jgi:hypothetical protein
MTNFASCCFLLLTSSRANGCLLIKLLIVNTICGTFNYCWLLVLASHELTHGLVMERDGVESFNLNQRPSHTCFPSAIKRAFDSTLLLCSTSPEEIFKLNSWDILLDSLWDVSCVRLLIYFLSAEYNFGLWMTN